MLAVQDRLEKKYIRAFLEIFESGYAPHVGDVERLAGKKTRRLYVTLPNNYADWLCKSTLLYKEIDGVLTIHFKKEFTCCAII